MGNTPGKVGDEEIVGDGSMHTNMMRMMKDDVFKKYKVLEVLGSGSMGFVAKARIRSKEVGGSAVKSKNPIAQRISIRRGSDLAERRESPVLYALKSIQVDRVSETFLDELKNEMDILRRLDHPNIVRAYEVFENKRQIYMVLELCDGGDLYARGPYSEKESASIVCQLLSAVKYLHDHGVVHRDLKFENIMWESDGPDAHIKVIDFGLSKKFGYGEKDIMHEGVGTIYTMAPQVLQGVYTSQADLWSVGVITYMLLSSQRPFQGRKRREVIDKIMRASYTLEGGNWKEISANAKDLVKCLLEVDPRARLNATSALKHKWLQTSDLSDNKPSAEATTQLKNTLDAYKNSSQLKKIALNVIAHRSTSKEILELRKLFDEYDMSNDGIIELHEFKAAMKKVSSQLTEEEVEDMFASIDIDNNGDIQYTEFLAAALECQNSIEEERIAEAFDRLDSDDSGYISRNNLINFLGKDATMMDVEQLLEEWDTNNDGKISYSEFKEMFKQNKAKTKKQIYGHSDTHDDDDEDGLLGLDARIPGGKYDKM